MNTDDPKFTAHALGETDDLTPAERAEIEALLAADAASADEADELRALAARLRSELQTEQTAPLTAAQRAAVLAANVVPVSFGGAGEEKKAAVQYPRPWFRAGPLALAASVALCGLLAWQAMIAPTPPMTDGLGFAKQSPPSEVRQKLDEQPLGPARENEPALDRGDMQVTVLATEALGLKRAESEKQLALEAPADPLARMGGELKSAPEAAPVVAAPAPASANAFSAATDAPGLAAEPALSDSDEPNLALLEAAGKKSPVASSSAVRGEGRAKGVKPAEAPLTDPAIPALAAAAPAPAKPAAPPPVTLALSDQFGDPAPAGETRAGVVSESISRGVVLTGKANGGAGNVAEKSKAQFGANPAMKLPVDRSQSSPTAAAAPQALGSSLAKANATERYYFESATGMVAGQPGAAAGNSTSRFSLNSRDTLSADSADREAEVRRRERRLSEVVETESDSSESYDFLADNAFAAVSQAPLSTFSIDVDTASYAIVRRFLNEQKLPPKGAVRIEELINYFSYDYPQPQGDAPFSATMEVAACPWTPAHRLVRIGLKGREIAKDKRPASNLVFLIDVSGSMQPANKLPLLKQSLGLLIDQLGPEDQVAMAVYAGSSGTVLEPTRSKAKMRAALAKLESGGSTNGASGVQLAYELAAKGFIKGGTNRVILATDGDWNVGVTNPAELFEMIAKKAKGGVFLTVLGYGMDNLKDSMLVKLADKGNGNYGYIDTLIEAKKLLADELTSTLVTIAKDVKIQVEFNPAQVAAYRLIGYEKRLLAKEDFNDDTKDAGEIGAGHTVTALYEVVPAGGNVPAQFAKVDELKYQRPAAPEKSAISNQQSAMPSPELLTLKLRYKAPDGDVSKLLEFPLTDDGKTWEKSSRDFRFAAAVAGYGMLLRDSPHKGAATWDSVRELAVEGKGEDPTGYRAEFITLLEKAKALAR